jgi:transposase-like protein
VTLSRKTGVSFSDNRLVMLDDILLKRKDTLIDSISIDSEFVFKSKPSHCPHCHSEKISGVEVMGAYMGNLLWECDKCDSIFLRFKKDKTEEYLQAAKGAWTNPNDWCYVPKSQFN